MFLLDEKYSNQTKSKVKVGIVSNVTIPNNDGLIDSILLLLKAF